MLELTYKNKVHLDKWDIDVRPYLTTGEMQVIYNDIIDEPNPIIRSEKIMATIIYLCTDLYKDEDADYSYEELIYSGLWDDILNACPYILSAIDNLNNAVKEHNSVDNQIKTLLVQLTNVINNADELINSDNFKEILNNIK